MHGEMSQGALELRDERAVMLRGIEERFAQLSVRWTQDGDMQDILYSPATAS